MHRYAAAQAVQFWPRYFEERPARGEPCVIVRLLPAVSGGDLRYHIKARDRSIERIVSESEILPFSGSRTSM
jgi:hypothetical protein